MHVHKYIIYTYLHTGNVLVLALAAVEYVPSKKMAVAWRRPVGNGRAYNFPNF